MITGIGPALWQTTNDEKQAQMKRLTDCSQNFYLLICESVVAFIFHRKQWLSEMLLTSLCQT